jgi:hypothetical protein
MALNISVRPHAGGIRDWNVALAASTDLEALGFPVTRTIKISGNIQTRSL